MTNKTISALSSASTIVGTEVLPIVQSSATVKVSVANLTSGLGTIIATKGGTGQTSYSVGDLLYADTTTTLAKLPDVATGNAVISGGVSTAPSWGKIGLTTHVSGILPVANGGTNASSAGIASFNNITGYSAAGATGTTTTNLVFSTSPTLVTPTLGAALATSIQFGSGAVLSDYEEGTWTPTLVCGTSGTITLSGSFAGTYTKIGRQVTVCVTVYANSVSTPLGSLTMNGLPYACNSGNSFGSGAAIHGQTTLVPAGSSLDARVIAGSSSIYIYAFTAGTIVNAASYVQATTLFTITCSYFV